MIETNDTPIIYRLKEKFITPDDTAAIKIICNFDAIYHMIRIDLKHEESTHFVKGDIPKIFAKDELFKANVITVEQNIANKIHTILKSLSNYFGYNKEIKRWKDFYDLYHLIDFGKFDLSLVEKHFIEKVKTDGKVDISHINWDFLKELESKYQEDAINNIYIQSKPFDEIVTASKDLTDEIKNNIM